MLRPPGGGGRSSRRPAPSAFSARPSAFSAPLRRARASRQHDAAPGRRAAATVRRTIRGTSPGDALGRHRLLRSTGADEAARKPRPTIAQPCVRSVAHGRRTPTPRPHYPSGPAPRRRPPPRRRSPARARWTRLDVPGLRSERQASSSASRASRGTSSSPSTPAQPVGAYHEVMHASPPSSRQPASRGRRGCIVRAATARRTARVHHRRDGRRDRRASCPGVATTARSSACGDRRATARSRRAMPTVFRRATARPVPSSIADSPLGRTSTRMFGLVDPTQRRFCAAKASGPRIRAASPPRYPWRRTCDEAAAALAD